MSSVEDCLYCVTARFLIHSSDTATRPLNLSLEAVMSFCPGQEGIKNSRPCFRISDNQGTDVSHPPTVGGRTISHARKVKFAPALL